MDSNKKKSFLQRLLADRTWKGELRDWIIISLFIWFVISMYDPNEDVILGYLSIRSS